MTPHEIDELHERYRPMEVSCGCILLTIEDIFEPCVEVIARYGSQYIGVKVGRMCSECKSLANSNEVYEHVVTQAIRDQMNEAD